MTNHYIEVNNINIHYIKQPGKTTRTILFLHGRAMSTDSWQEQFRSDLLSEYRLIALDFPGHGLSDHNEDFEAAYSISGFKEVLLEFINLLGLSDYVLAGLSLGAHIALQTLPDLPSCRGIFAMTMPITKPVQPNLMYQNASILGKAFQTGASPEDVTSYASKLLRPAAENIPEFIENSYYQADPKIHEGILNCLLKGEHLDEADVIKNSRVPISIVAGNDEQIHNLTYLDSFQMPVWRGEYQLVAKSGHLLNWENPGEVNRLLYAFTSDCYL